MIDWIDLAAAICLVLGGVLTLAAGVGLVRFPDALSRLHAGTKPQILGLMFVVAAIALEMRSWPTLLALLPVLVFQMLTAPVAAHMVGRAGYRTDNYRSDLLLMDELQDDIDRASKSEEREERAAQRARERAQRDADARRQESARSKRGPKRRR